MQAKVWITLMGISLFASHLSVASSPVSAKSQLEHQLRHPGTWSADCGWLSPQCSPTLPWSRIKWELEDLAFLNFPQLDLDLTCNLKLKPVQSCRLVSRSVSSHCLFNWILIPTHAHKWSKLVFLYFDLFLLKGCKKYCKIVHKYVYTFVGLLLIWFYVATVPLMKQCLETSEGS